ncbi:hypothetical protein Tco_0030183, partial [Tanacetum coccineum]
SYESSPSSSPPDLPSRKRYRGTSELVEDDDEDEDDEEWDDKEEDEEMEKSLDFDNLSKDAEDEGPTIEDEDPAAGDEGLAAGDEGPSMGVESLSLGGDKVVPRGQQRATSVAETAVGEPLGLGYGALRRWEIALGEGRMPSVFEVGGLIHDHTVRLEVLSPALFERSLEHERERVPVTVGAIWRPVLALESWAGQTDARIAALWHAISDTHRENWELRL